MSFDIRLLVEGWRNHLVPPEDLKDLIEEVSKERLELCAGCPWQSNNAKEAGKKIMRPDLHCTKCGCTLVAKTKSLSSRCPLEPPKWDVVVNDAERYEIEKQIRQHNEIDKLQAGSNKGSEGTSDSVSESSTN